MRKSWITPVSAVLIVLFLGGPAWGQEKKKDDKKSGLEQLFNLGATVLEATKEMAPFTYEEERTIGQSVAIEVMARNGGAYLKEIPFLYVNKVGLSIARYSDRPNIPYHFAILNSEEANAFACPGGYIFVTLGLVRLIRDEAELAGVLAHEIAHVTEKHALTTIRRNRVLQSIGKITMTAMKKDPGVINQLTSLTTDVLFNKGVDKEMEFEADRKGTEYAYRTGYDPSGLMRFIRTLQDYRGKKQSVWFSTHPDTGERIRRLETQALPAYGRTQGLATNADRFKKYMVLSQ
jgi:predicted Zn-dependent protease